MTAIVAGIQPLNGKEPAAIREIYASVIKKSVMSR